MAECARSAQIAGRRTKTRVIESVEHFHPKVEITSFGKMELLSYRRIEIEVGGSLFRGNRRVSKQARSGVAVSALTVVHTRREAQGIPRAEPIVDRLILVGQRAVP